MGAEFQGDVAQAHVGRVVGSGRRAGCIVLRTLFLAAARSRKDVGDGGNIDEPRTRRQSTEICSAAFVLGLFLPERTDNHSNHSTMHGTEAHNEGACVRRSQEDQGGMHMTEPTRMDDKAIAELAILEAKREGVEVPYRLVLIRQGEHEKAGRFKEASECCAIRYCLEIVAELSPKESAANAWGDWATVNEQAWYWWWDQDPDSGPVPVSILHSGSDGKYFASVGQRGWNRAQNVEEMGGRWMLMREPELPRERGTP